MSSGKINLIKSEGDGDFKICGIYIWALGPIVLNALSIEDPNSLLF